MVNTNRIKPPIAPIGLEYVAEALAAAGNPADILDLCWLNDYTPAIAGFFRDRNFGVVGVTLRNTDDCAFTSRQSFMNEFAGIINTIRIHTDAMIVVGGVGFSVMPEDVLGFCKADAGIWGDGEFVLSDLVGRIKCKKEWSDLPGILHREKGIGWLKNPPLFKDLSCLPLMKRGLIDNRRYFDEGGQAGIETKRGCPRNCIYCADPLAKGKKVRIRPPKAVVDEMENLLAQGIDHIHICDSEFNIPEWHARKICREMIRRNLCDVFRWYAYCSPIPFSRGLARAMKKAGCAGINFGADHGDSHMLKKLGRSFLPDDIVDAIKSCKEEGIAVMVDLLIGSPGETRESIVKTVDMVRRANPDRAGIAIGVRVYPGTRLSGLLMQDRSGNGFVGGGDLSDPLFFIEPDVAPYAFELLDRLIGNDSRFFFFDPSRLDRNYNYNANQQLVDAIKKGYRGAYWDILRVISGIKS
ncbi:radical SAM protein [bacterium]|nr:radical SAM protein [bacterium]